MGGSEEPRGALSEFGDDRPSRCRPTGLRVSFHRERSEEEHQNSQYRSLDNDRADPLSTPQNVPHDYPGANQIPLF
jgi:hypothetical protein